MINTFLKYKSFVLRYSILFIILVTFSIAIRYYRDRSQQDVGPETVLVYLFGCAGILVLAILVHSFITNKVAFDRQIAKQRSVVLAIYGLAIVAVPCLIAMITDLIGFKGYEILYDDQLYPNLEHPEISSPSIFWSILYIFQDPGNQHMAMSGSSRLLAMILGLLGTIMLTGILVSMCVSFFESYITSWKEGLITYNFKTNSNVVVIGFHQGIAELIRQIISKFDPKYIIIQTKQDIPYCRRFLESNLSSDDMVRIVLYRGDRESELDMDRLHLEYESVKAVYILGEQLHDSSMEAANDEGNINCLELILKRRNGINNEGKKLTCYILLEHQSSNMAFMLNGNSERVNRSLSIIPFNYYEMWAQKVFGLGVKKTDGYSYLDDGIPKDSDKFVHLVIIGMSRMGMALSKEAALICHYPNYAREEIKEEIELGQKIISNRNNVNDPKTKSNKSKLRTKITFIDPDADTQMKLFQNRCRDLFALSRWGYMNLEEDREMHWTDQINECADKLRGKNEKTGFKYSNLVEPMLEDANFMDIEWSFVKAEIESPKTNEYLENISNNPNCVLTIAFCSNNDERNIAAATYLSDTVYSAARQVLVRQSFGGQVANMLSGSLFGEKSGYFHKIKPFGMYTDFFDQKDLDADFAKIIHFSKDSKDNLNSLRSRDWSDVDGNPSLVRWSSIFSAHAWQTKFRSMGLDFSDADSDKFCLMFPNVDECNNENLYEICLWCRVEHNRWMMERLLIMGERPLQDCEWNEFINGRSYYPLLPDSNPISLTEFMKKTPDDIKLLKDRMKKMARHPHLDICSYWQLRQRDCEAIRYDADRYHRFAKCIHVIFSRELLHI